MVFPSCVYVVGEHMYLAQLYHSQHQKRALGLGVLAANEVNCLYEGKENEILSSPPITGRRTILSSAI